MNVEFINPFLLSTISVFDAMLNCKLHRGVPYLIKNAQPQHDVSGVIGLSGKAQGTVVLGLSREAALRVAETLLQERPPEINHDVIDAVGELVNIIAGRAKSKLEHLEMSLSLPTVITGKFHCVEFPTSITPICIPFESEWGEVSMEIGFRETVGAKLVTAAGVSTVASDTKESEA
jgi:chemotaxis protein CheX